MKRIASLFTFILFSTFMLTSCLDDDDPANTASVYYIGLVDSVKYSDPADSVWSRNISQALYELKVINVGFNERDTLDYGLQEYTIQNCNIKAGATFDNMLKTLNLSVLKRQIFNSHADSLIRLGYKDGAESLPIDPFTLHSSLWSLYTNSEIFYYTTEVK